MKKKAIGSLVLVSAMAMGNMSAFAADATKNADGKYDPEITITIGKQLDENTGRYGDGEDINKNPMTELTRESLGINMETTLLGGDASNYETKLRLALTSSDDLPDVFPVYSAQLAADMIESGMVKDITEDIENYMPERLKEIYDQYPNTYSTVTNDGKIYGMAVSPHLTEGEVMIIRQDWLDKLGLKAPTTIDEFEEVIRAFTEDDPDGNGQKDTYGFTYEGDSIYNNGWCADPVTIFSVFSGDMLPGQWQEDEDGKLVYGSLDEGNKQALERMAKWHANGWTFQEAAATGAWDAMTQFTEGKAGIFIGRPWCIDSVKDEPYMVDYLRKLVDWEQYGFEHVYTAGGGSMARDMLDKYQPELLITDIRMPKISGLDLCRHIFEKKYLTKVMILSGYGEFEYAKQAIQYGVSEYLLKPILKDEFEEILEKMLERHFATQKEQQEKEKTGDVIFEVENYIKENIESDLSLELLARVVHLNPSYLSRYFKESTGENLSNYVTRCKMEKAAWLLDNTEQKINEIMLQLGYQKSQHFAKIFREQYGVSPKEYKKGIRG